MKVVIAGGLIPIALAIIMFGTSRYFWSPLFLLATGATIISLANPSKITAILLIASLVLFVIAYTAEPRWLELWLKSVS